MRNLYSYLYFNKTSYEMDSYYVNFKKSAPVIIKQLKNP